MRQLELAAVLIAGLAGACMAGDQAGLNLFSDDAPVVTEAGDVCALNLFALAEVETPPRLQVLCFGAEWCGPCVHQVKPALQEVAAIETETPWTVGKAETNRIRTVDVDQEAELARRYRIDRVPCFVRLQRDASGQVRITHRHYGPLTADQICSFFNDGVTNHRQ